MIIASRTPEGQPNRCPVCGNKVRIEPSAPLEDSKFGDAPCPNCGALLWFVNDNTESRLYEARTIESLASRIAAAFGRLIGANANDVAGDTSFLGEVGADSLDTVELVMELEEQGIVLTGDQAAQITTVADAISFLRSHRPGRAEDG